jgi:hypothetical protein
MLIYPVELPEYDDSAAVSGRAVVVYGGEFS